MTLFYFLNSQIPANFSGKFVVNFLVARHGGGKFILRIYKHRMFSAFPMEQASLAI